MTPAEVTAWLRREATDCTRVISEWEKADPSSESEILSGFRAGLAMYTTAADLIESLTAENARLKGESK